MKSKKTFKFALFFFFVWSVLTFMILENGILSDVIIKVPPMKSAYTVHNDNNRFLIYSNKCAIPMLYKFPPSLRNIIHIRKNIICDSPSYITYRDHYTIKVNNSVIETRYPTFTFCEYIPFKKKINSSTGSVEILERKRKFVTDVKAMDEFVTVKCFNKSHNLIGLQQYSFIIRNKTLDFIYESRYNKSAKRRPMNVLVLTFESTSRLNFVRHMNMTYDYIMNEMNAVEMFGYNKFGINTFPNMVGVFLGIPEIEMNYSRGFLDNYPFIWKDFTKSGYRTFTTEDDVGISTFHYLIKGFRNAPVDHYFLPFMDVLEKTNREGLCSGNKQLMEIMLEQLVEFISVYNDVPHFAFTMIGSRQTHDDSNGLGIEDLPYLRMLKYLRKYNYLENTVLLFLGDHGIRYGRLRSTYQGRLEENLPALYIVLPQWFRNKYKTLYDNLKSNSRKLTSNVDVYATFHDIINIGKGQLNYMYRGKYGISLLRKIPVNRSCQDLKIPQVFCTCGMYRKVNVTDTVIRLASVIVVSSINKILEGVSDVCVKLRLDKVLSSEKRFAPQFYLTNRPVSGITVYIVRVRVQPSGGIFEAHVFCDTDLTNMKVIGTISRVNAYRGQSYCVEEMKNAIILERYCFCKTQLKFKNS